MDLQLKGKVALITAASKGIGFAVAQRLVREGANVAINSRSAESLHEAASRLVGGATVTCHPADLADSDAISNMVEDVFNKHERIDILVLNTPGPRIAPFLEVPIEEWDAAYGVMVRPVVQLARAVGQRMVLQGSGSIVCLTSTWVKQPALGGVLSAALRSALSALCKQMALELAKHGVRVNQIMPGATATDRMKAIVESKAAKTGTSTEAVLKDMLRQIPLARWAEAQEIADTVAFVASPASAFTTGIALAVDGGAIQNTL